MHNVEAFIALENLADDAINNAWKNLIYSIQAFYSQDFIKMELFLSRIPDDSEPARLKKPLFYMAGFLSEDEKLSFREEKLVKRVTENSRFLKSAIEQLKESIDYGEDLFAETASLLIKELKPKAPEAAERLALWCFRICSENDFDDEILADNILLLFGQAEGLRLIGLSLIETEPDSALVCFTRSLIKKVSDKKTGREETSAYLEIIRALLSACAEEDPVLIDINEMLSMLESELKIFFGIKTELEPGSPLEKISSLIAAMTREPASEKTVSSERKPAPAVRDAVQLELF